MSSRQILVFTLALTGCSGASPESKDVAVEEEAVAERGRALEKGEEGLLDLGQGGAHVGVGQDEETLTEHDRR